MYKVNRFLGEVLLHYDGEKCTLIIRQDHVPNTQHCYPLVKTCQKLYSSPRTLNEQVIV